MRIVALIVLALLLTNGVRATAAESGIPPGSVPSWGEMLDRVQSDSSLDPARASLIAKAHEAAEKSVVRRAHKLEDVGKNRTWLDGRSNALEPEIKETFALAMSDFAACNTLAEELPLLAAAFRLTRDALYRDRIIAQMEEMVSWSPLQRPGWTLYTPGHRLPADGKDGNWLATGCGMRAIGNMFELLPPGALDDALVTKIHSLIESEIVGVVDDWRTKRSWFISSNNPVTNQWVLPNEGLVRACLILGKDDRRDAYELGVKNLLMALDAHGQDGEFEEGFGYASFTVTSMLHAAHAMAVAGDRRAIDHPFLKRFPTWLVHHFQPGKMVINCFDAGAAYEGAERSRSLLSLLAVCAESRVAQWALANQTRGPSDDLPGLSARSLPAVGPEASPPLFAYYDRAARVNWRDSWAADATGVWVRGGHPLDQHDHQDRCHVNFIARGRPILIEAGTPSYSHKLMMTHYSTGVGHNVLQLGGYMPERLANPGELVTCPGWQKRGGVAPITKHRMEATGGEVTVDGTACYDGLSKWVRSVIWKTEGAPVLAVADDVALAEGQKNVVLFRWHLGTESEASINGDGGKYEMKWPDALMTIDSETPLQVAQVKLPDNTLAGHTGEEDPGNFHTCVIVQTHEETPSARITVNIRTRIVE